MPYSDTFVRVYEASKSRSCHSCELFPQIHARLPRWNCSFQTCKELQCLCASVRVFFPFLFFWMLPQRAERKWQVSNCRGRSSKNTDNACEETVLRTEYVQKIFWVLKNWDEPNPLFWTTIPTSEYRWIGEISRYCLQHCVARSALRKWHCCCFWLKQLVWETQLDLNLITLNVWIRINVVYTTIFATSIRKLIKKNNFVRTQWLTLGFCFVTPTFDNILTRARVLSRHTKHFFLIITLLCVHLFKEPLSEQKLHLKWRDIHIPRTFNFQDFLKF